MSLQAYNQKRDFKKTAEPTGKTESAKGALRFVVQKHDASRLHYDFRLEVDGVLKSWAVPKGPSLNPADKRLAMHVEDHPVAYRNFEGLIPAGEYGGGTVMVWDEGVYEPTDAQGAGRNEAERLMREGLAKGRVTFVLQGKKLQGEFTLMQLRGREENAWLLVKKKDAFSSAEDVTAQGLSVKSGKTLAQIAAEGGAELNHPEDEKVPAKAQKEAASKAATASPKTASTAKRKDAFPTPDFTPMLATLGGEAFDDKQWLYEVKWDGYRALAFCKGKKVTLLSRNKKPFTEKYAPVARALEALKLNAVFDGEIIAVDESGNANFQALQNWQNTPVALQYHVFDALWLNGRDLTNLPLSERKTLLRQAIPQKHETIFFSEHVVGKGKAFFERAVKAGLEGIMAKRADSLYRINSRTEDWLKIKAVRRQEVVIAGFTKPRASRQHFGSLLLGVYEGHELVYVGHTGSGFNTQTLADLHKKLQPLVTDKSPFAKTPKTNMPATWVKPKLVCEIKFTEWTADRMARHPIFMGLRTDKKASEVVMEKTTIAAAKKGKTASNAAAKKQTVASKKASGKALRQLDLDGPTDQALTLNGHELQLTNLQKIYWPDEGFRKGDVLNYYLRMAPYILPYLKDRPQSLRRHPSGINGASFFQKDVAGKVPAWMQTFAEFSESTNETVNYLVCSNEATLLYMANLGCIEINPWHTRTQQPLNPDWCLLDLDPHTGNSFDDVMEVAKVLKQILDETKITGCLKTSGSSGLHVYIPLGAKYGYDSSRLLAETLVKAVNKELPKLTSLERTPAKRKNKVYLDFLQNSETQTAAAPYSLRPKPGVPVSTPLDWSELKKGLTPRTWNARNIYDRVKEVGDLFAPVLKKGVDVEKALARLAALSKE